MNKPYPPNKPQKYFGGEEVERYYLEDRQLLMILDQINFDYVIDTEYDAWNDQVMYLSKRTKETENLNYKKDQENYKLLMAKYRKDKKEWSALERERKKKENIKKVVEKKDIEYLTYLKLKKKYEK